MDFGRGIPMYLLKSLNKFTRIPIWKIVISVFTIANTLVCSYKGLTHGSSPTSGCKKRNDYIFTGEGESFFHDRLS